MILLMEATLSDVVTVISSGNDFMQVGFGFVVGLLIVLILATSWRY